MHCLTQQAAERLQRKKYFWAVTFQICQRLTGYHGTERRNTIYSTDTGWRYRMFFCISRSLQPSALLLIVQIVGCSEDAEELVQDVFLKAFRCLGGYRGECRFSTWLYRIAYTTAVSATRKKKQEFLYIEENTINNVPDEKADDILYPTDDEERTARLIQAIDLLNVEEKALITLFYYEEKSIEEIGEVLKLSPGNVKVKLHRTRKKIYVLMNGKE